MVQKAVWVVVGVVLVVVLLWYFYPHSAPSSSQTQSNAQPALAGKQNEKVLTKSQTLKELMDSGVSEKCDFNVEDTKNPVSGRFYLSGGKVRGYFSSLVNGQELASNLIGDGKTAYIWTDGQTTGKKISASSMMGGQDVSKLGIDPNTKYVYTCTERGVGSEVFNLPDGVSFS